jgi:hypothetical protein
MRSILRNLLLLDHRLQDGNGEDKSLSLVLESCVYSELALVLDKDSKLRGC